MYHVYVLENNLGQYYSGSCEDLQKRLKRHNQNSVRFTKNKGPWKIAYQETVENRTQARKREHEIKRHKNLKHFLALSHKTFVPIV
ncbi:MAG: GIY-YIG nuclease family protein [Candidatus Omnitrophota bacterium]